MGGVPRDINNPLDSSKCSVNRNCLAPNKKTITLSTIELRSLHDVQYKVSSFQSISEILYEMYKQVSSLAKSLVYVDYTFEISRESEIHRSKTG